jgi:hypothetical protein
MSNCPSCQAPGRELWAINGPPHLDDLDTANWMFLQRCSTCAQLWCQVPYEPHGSFRYWVAWDHGVDRWHRVRDREPDARTLHAWFKCRLARLLPQANAEDELNVERHQQRAYGRSPLDSIPNDCSAVFRLVAEA